MCHSLTPPELSRNRARKSKTIPMPYITLANYQAVVDKINRNVAKGERLKIPTYS